MSICKSECSGYNDARSIRISDAYDDGVTYVPDGSDYLNNSVFLLKSTYRLFRVGILKEIEFGPDGNNLLYKYVYLPIYYTYIITIAITDNGVPLQIYTHSKEGIIFIYIF